MAILTPFQNFHLVARDMIVSDLQSGLFTPGTIAGMLAIKGGSNSYTPDDSIVIGKRTTKFQRKSLKGGNQAVIPFMNTLNDDTKSVGYNDTDVQFDTTLQNENNNTAQVSWGELRSGISIDNQIIKNAMRQARNDREALGYLIDPIQSATREARSRHMDNLSRLLVNGTPTNYSADIWGGAGGGDPLAGILLWISDRNDIASVDRTADTGAGFRAQRSTAALNASLSLIDQIIVGGVPNGLVTALPLPTGISYGDTMGTATGGADGLSTTGLNAKGSAADIAICSPDVYAKLKQEAISRNLYINIADKGEETTFLGFTRESFKYNRTEIALDYFLPANTLLVLDSSTFVLHLDELLEVAPFADLPKVLPATAQPNRTTSTLCSRLRFYCDAPWKNFYGSNVS